ncbi:hypothetical protein, partial [Staphylococcus aureus]|uniref:hypothetical protein n=1 Tax=Staphylococcus aureus TaxID=1280 RepID=UPI00301E27C5
MDEVTIITLSLAFSCGVAANELQTLNSNQSFSGLVFNPNAQVKEYGDFGVSFAQGRPWLDEVQGLDSIKVSFGLIEGLEAHGSIVTYDYNSNCFKTGCGGIRDLSLSLKYQVPNFWGNENLDFALGMQDVGGAATKLMTN